MPTVMAYHDVKDKDHWLASPKREEFFGPLGVTNIRTFVDPENPTRVGLVMDVADMDAVMAAMETQPAADAMAHDGVLPETLVFWSRRNPRAPSSTANPARRTFLNTRAALVALRCETRLPRRRCGLVCEGGYAWATTRAAPGPPR